MRLMVIIALSLLVSGCNAPEEDETRSVSLNYTYGSPAPEEVHQKTIACGVDTRFAMGAEVDAGRATVTIRDGGGALVHNQEFAGSDTVIEPVQGSPGQWIIKLTLSGGFQGSVSTSLSCTV